jgi:hypothetical protein
MGTSGRSARPPPPSSNDASRQLASRAAPINDVADGHQRAPPGDPPHGPHPHQARRLITLFALVCLVAASAFAEVATPIDNSEFGTRPTTSVLCDQVHAPHRQSAEQPKQAHAAHQQLVNNTVLKCNTAHRATTPLTRVGSAASAFAEAAKPIDNSEFGTRPTTSVLCDQVHAPHRQSAEQPKQAHAARQQHVNEIVSMRVTGTASF